MYEDTVVSFSHPDRISLEDPLTQVLRLGARRLLADAVEAEVEAFIAAHARLGSVWTTGRTGVAKSQVSRPSARTRTVSRGGFAVRAAS